MTFLDRFKSVKEGSKPAGPPSPREVAARACALQVVVGYSKSVATIEVPPSFLPSLRADEVKTIQEVSGKVSRNAIATAKQGGFWSYLSPREKALLETPFAKIEDYEIVAGSWRHEAFQMLCWALKLVATVPPYDEQAGDGLFKLIDLHQFETFTESVELRAAEELSVARDNAELWHWRSRTRQLIEKGEPFPAQGAFKTYDDVVRFTARAARDKGTFSQIIDDDFPVAGKAYRDLSDDEWGNLTSITMERHFALNWLCGYAPGNRWDETPTET